MKITVDVNLAKQLFKNYDRDKFTIEAIEAILDYYDEFDSSIEFDVIGICCDWTEYEPDDFIYQYGDEIDDLHNLTEKEQIRAIIEKLEDRTYLIELDNGNILMQAY